MKQLTEKQKRFADYYVESGNGSESYKRAYPTCKKDDTARVNASKLLTKANIKEYIDSINQELYSARIADMKEVKEFWSKMMRDDEVDNRDRLKASEFLGKTNAAFVEKVEHSGNISVKIVDDIPDCGMDDEDELDMILEEEDRLDYEN